MLEAQTAPGVASFSTHSSSQTISGPPKPSVHPFAPLDKFSRRHIGPQPQDIKAMLELLGYSSLDELTDAVVPPALALRRSLDLPPAKGEHEALEALREIMAHN